MATAVPLRLTKPRLSLLILEATATVVCLVLVLWLLLWFVHRTVQQGGVEAYFVGTDGVPPEEVPFQAADVRRFRGSSGSHEVRETVLSELPDEVLKKARSGGSTLVVYISTPVLGQETGKSSEPIRKLIRDVAREAKRDVVLALDLAQVDTDRELGVFGNSPYSRLADEIRKIVKEQGKPGSNLFILTSAAPAQKSWSADGLGQSIFADYLRKGLEGGAKGWDAEDPESITVEGLHRYVLQNVRRWARLRRASDQTPQLLPFLPEGDKPRTVVLRPIRRDAGAALAANTTPATGASQAPGSSGEKATARPEAGEKAVAVAPVEKGQGPVEKGQGPPPDSAPDAFASLWDDLFKEWKQHDEVRGRKPYRELPGAWRSYEAALLRAERCLRAARRDPTLWDQRARDALAAARDKRQRLEQDWKSRREVRNSFPFRPIRDDPVGEKQLVDALTHLKVKQRPAWLDPGAAHSEGPKAAADKDAARTGPAGGGPVAMPPIPPAFNDPVDKIRFLELQVPAWAYRFQAAFRCSAYFSNQGRDQRLVRLVELRLDAEGALAADRRGLGWIRPLIEIGDRDRRSIQDKLFGGARNDPAEEESRIDSHVKSAYDAARTAIDHYVKAREAWEQAAHQLPYYAEWAIRREAMPGRGTPGLPARPLPESVDLALRELDGLARALVPPQLPGGQDDDNAIMTAIDEQVRKLANATGSLSDARRALEEDFKRSTDSYLTGGTAGWIELDAALRVPLIDAAKREVLLKNLLDQRETVDDIGSPGAEGTEPGGGPPIDRGFWVRAAGLARLDLRLRRMNHGPRAGEAPEEDAAIKGIWETVRQVANDPGVAPEALPAFDPINQIVGKLRGEARIRLAERSPDDPDVGMSDAQNELRTRDRESRLLTATEVDTLLSGTDRPARDYERLAECACLDFHLARLQKDYAEDRSLKAITGQVDDRKDALGIARTEAPIPGSGGLTVNVAPRRPPAIDDKDWKTEFNVIVAARQGNARELRPIPPGEAFVGLVGAADGLTANDQPLGDVPGGLVGVPFEPTTRREVKFRIVQGDKVTLPGDADTLALDGKIFYRGRVNLAEPVSIAVQPRKIDQRIAFRISQDQEKLKEKYPGVDRIIPDQFKNHQNTGFLHKGKDLDYVIEIENKTPRPLTVVCRHYLIDDMTMAKTETLPPVERQELKPGVPMPVFRGRVRASDAPNRRPHVRVEVTEVKPQGEIPPFNVVFKEIGWQEYMSIEKSYDPNHEFTDNNGARQVGLCFLVKMRRAENDPVTEPIPTDQLRCEFSAGDFRPPPLSGADQGKRWLWPGKEIEFYQPMPGLKRPLKWTPEIEGERLETREEP